LVGALLGKTVFEALLLKRFFLKGPLGKGFLWFYRQGFLRKDSFEGAPLKRYFKRVPLEKVPMEWCQLQYNQLL